MPFSNFDNFLELLNKSDCLYASKKEETIYPLIDSKFKKYFKNSR